MIRYIQVQDGYITDMIDYAYGDYIRIESDDVPEDLHCACYKYLGGNDWALDQTKHQAMMAEL